MAHDFFGEISSQSDEKGKYSASMVVNNYVFGVPLSAWLGFGRNFTLCSIQWGVILWKVCLKCSAGQWAKSISCCAGRRNFNDETKKHRDQSDATQCREVEQHCRTSNQQNVADHHSRPVVSSVPFWYVALWRSRSVSSYINARNLIALDSCFSKKAAQTRQNNTECAFSYRYLSAKLLLFCQKWLFEGAYWMVDLFPPVAIANINKFFLCGMDLKVCHSLPNDFKPRTINFQITKTGSHVSRPR